VSHKLPPDIADRLLDRLSEDDAFREMFRRDPRAALASVGYADAADTSLEDGAWSCLHGENLPDKQALKDARRALHEQMTSQDGMSFVIFKVSAD
jgi:putative modified peptide